MGSLPDLLTADASAGGRAVFRHSPRRRPATRCQPIMQTHGLVKIYNKRTVVNQVDVNVRRGEIVGLLGPNGAGKTTSFYMIVGLVPPNAGRITFNGVDVTRCPCTAARASAWATCRRRSPSSAS